MVHSSYQNFSYALLNDKGCAEIRQVFDGPFEQATIEGANVVQLFFWAGHQFV